MIKQISYPLQPSPGGGGRKGQIIGLVLVLGLVVWQVYYSRKIAKEDKNMEDTVAKQDSENNKVEDGNLNS